MLLDLTKGFLIPACYLVFVIVLKKFWFDKKYDKRKSSIISDCLNGMLIIYFLAVGDWLLLLMFVIIAISRFNYYKPRVKK